MPGWVAYDWLDRRARQGLERGGSHVLVLTMQHDRTFGQTIEWRALLYRCSACAGKKQGSGPQPYRQLSVPSSSVPELQPPREPTPSPSSLKPSSTCLKAAQYPAVPIMRHSDSSKPSSTYHEAIQQTEDRLDLLR